MDVANAILIAKKGWDFIRNLCLREPERQGIKPKKESNHMKSVTSSWRSVFPITVSASTYSPIPVPVAIPHMKDSRTHHRKGEFWIFCRMPKASGRNLVQVAVSGLESETVAESVSDIFTLYRSVN